MEAALGFALCGRGTALLLGALGHGLTLLAGDAPA